MNIEDYNRIVKKHMPKENKLKNAMIAFVSGGCLGILTYILFNIFYKLFGMPLTESYTLSTIILILGASILTGLNIFDKAVNIFKAGLLVPITGFAHGMTAAAVDGKQEGCILGVGGSMFKLAGSVIIFGVVAAFIFAVIKGVFL